MTCPHLIDNNCQLVVIAAPPPCTICRQQWPRGEPPTEPTPALRYLASLPTERPIRTVAQRKAGKRMKRRRPTECDHSGRVLRHGPTCGSRVYTCDLHGEATCQQCTICADFVQIQILTP